MLIFVTGATGFIGSAVVPELLAAGHQVLGLTRSEEGAAKMRAAGVEAHLGTLEDPASLTRGAEKADAVIHLAFDHDFSNFQANCQKDAVAIAALGKALIGSDRPLLITSGVGMGIAAHGELAREDVLDLDHRNPRIASERAGQALLDDGVNLSTMRLSQIHDTRRQGLVTFLIDIARAKGRAAYIGDGATRWSACHLGDTARIFRLALDRAERGARYHAVAEEAVSLRDIAGAIGEALDIPVASLTPEQAQDHFGPMIGFTTLDMPASSARTRATLGWEPVGPDLLSNIRALEVG
ncbi:NAD-dependent dehydratase [Rhizobium sp. Root274]|uniref:SDR family oxidoreductase n=1 Tax=unclassified Rhizobium TaxID=2613769 RepID=UPI0007148A9C|nr:MULTISPECIES: SDR family oxidoreductase [unclassified Rhizobium]KQW29047.1 NAD-dependent dehydratase [Rhizobium sp. Root1240]KRD29243.1 NAD-dependent dehydratase [Rhizobium sp. Root274]